MSSLDMTKVQKKKPPGSWNKVKIEGNVVSEEGVGLEGLIGLEVLETYSNNLVQREKKSKKQLLKERREAKLQLKRLKIDDLSDSGINSSDEDYERPKKKKKKKQKQQDVDKTEPQNYPGRFVLLKPPTDDPVEDEPKRVEHEEVGSNDGVNIDDLVHWNGLGIPENILKAIAELGFKTPTEIQSLTLPAAIMGKKDILGAAETGSGKTLAFGIPILAGILELKRKNVNSGIRKVKAGNVIPDRHETDNLTPPPEELDDFPEVENNSDAEIQVEKIAKPLYALILTPTRELAVQVKDHIAAVAKYTGIKVAAIFGGLSAVKQERVLKQCPEIVVATPGRLWELLELGNSHLSKLDDISFLVIDETDRMVEKGHFEELQMLLKRLNNDEIKKQTRQNFIFSATLTLVHDLPDYLQKKNMNRKNKLTKQTSAMKIQNLIDSLGISQPKIVDITNSNQTAETLTECRLICQIDHKDFYLYYFLKKHPGRTIVFCNSIGCVKRLAQLFNLLDCQPLPLHASMIQKQRLKNLEKFRKNPNGLLIATDVAARGLDIPDVQHVIHYQVPRTSENYVHRSGRTARANKYGITVIIMEPAEAKNYLKLCKTLNRSEDLPIFPVSERHLAAVKDRVNLARDVDQLELKLKREMSEIGWMKKSAQEMDIILENENFSDESELSEDDENVIKKNRDKRTLITKRHQLKALLKKPLFPKGFSYKYPTSAGKLEIPFTTGEADSSSAIKVVQDAIQERKEAKKHRNKRKRTQENE